MLSLKFQVVGYVQSGGGHWGVLETAKPKEKIIQNRKTVKKFGQNRKPHTKPSKTDTMVTSGAYRANETNTNFTKVFVNVMDFV